MADGIVLLFKPAGISSFKALYTVRRRFGTKRVGHVGTLDPFAEGLLIALSGSMTRLAFLFSGLGKEYRAVFRFGEETESFDPERPVVRRAPVPSFEEIESRLDDFRGEIDQVPPAHSAVHFQGTRAYVLARKGKKPELPSRRVTIFRLTPLDWAAPRLTLEIACSTGTYIRSLARDLGERTSSCAYVENLSRTAIGPFRAEEAQSLDELEEQIPIPSAVELLRRLDGLQVTTVPPSIVQDIRTGRRFDLASLEAPPVNGRTLFVGDDGTALAVAEIEGSNFRYLCVLLAPDDGGRV